MKRIMNMRARADGGYTLIELIVTLAVLAIIAAPLAGAFVAGAKANRHADMELGAGHIAQMYMEKWKAKSVIGTVLSETATEGDYRVAVSAAPVTNSISGSSVTSDADTAQLSDVSEYDFTTSDGITPDIEIKATELDSSASGIDMALNSSGTLSYVSGTSIGAKSGLTGGIVNVKFHVDKDMDSAFEMKASNESSAQTLNVYVIKDQNTSGGYFIDSGITVSPAPPGANMKENVFFIRNIKGYPSADSMDKKRLYKIDVSVSRADDSTNRPIVKITGYKSIR